MKSTDSRAYSIAASKVLNCIRHAIPESLILMKPEDAENIADLADTLALLLRNERVARKREEAAEKKEIQDAIAKDYENPPF